MMNLVTLLEMKLPTSTFGEVLKKLRSLTAEGVDARSLRLSPFMAFRLNKGPVRCIERSRDKVISPVFRTLIDTPRLILRPAAKSLLNHVSWKLDKTMSQNHTVRIPQLMQKVSKLRSWGQGRNLLLAFRRAVSFHCNHLLTTNNRMTWNELLNILTEYGRIEIKSQHMDWFMAWLTVNYPDLQVERIETTYGKSILKLK